MNQSPVHHFTKDVYYKWEKVAIVFKLIFFSCWLAAFNAGLKERWSGERAAKPYMKLIKECFVTILKVLQIK